MAKPPAVIRLRGVRQNNLKNFDLELPLGQLIVVTGLSGSGKSSLAFETLFAEGQRRYIETFSPYARQFFDRMDKPAVDSIEGIPPAIAIEQRNTVRTTRSTVGTMTEICEHMKLLWPHLARLHCRQCGQPVRKDSPREIWRAASAAEPLIAEALITFTLPLTDKLSLAESLVLVAKQGYQRLLVGNDVVRLEEAAERLTNQRALTIIQDRLKIGPANRARFIEACEQAYHFGKGKLAVRPLRNSATTDSSPLPFSARRHCAACDLEYREPTSALFSFNHPLGACPACKGFGRIISIDYNLALPDRTKTLAGGAIKAWQTGMSAECQDDMMKFCRKLGVPTAVPFNELEPRWQQWVIDGDPDYDTKDPKHSWPNRWYGLKGYFRWLESKAYKMHVRVLLSRYRAYSTCPECHGNRLQPEALLYRMSRPLTPTLSPDGREGVSAGLSLADFYRLPLRDAHALIEKLHAERTIAKGDPLAIVLEDVRARLGYLVEAGLGYLTLDRPTRTLSGGETERVNLTTCLGTRLVNTLFVLDEPSVGLHPRDTGRLVKILERLRDTGNTVVVVEHEASLMRAADQIIDLGPGHGEAGGSVVFQGTFKEILRARGSLTGEYLSGRKSIRLPARRPVMIKPAIGKSPLTPAFSPDGGEGVLALRHAAAHNLRDLAVDIPLGRLVCITGVSGSGKTTLAREVLLPLLTEQLGGVKPNISLEAGSADEGDEGKEEREASARLAATLNGTESLGRVVLVDQSALGKTPRSNPAVYIGAFEDLRELFAQSETARQRGLKDSAFSFNSAQGQCERCRGAGFEKIEMQFLSDVFIRCPDCGGRRYRSHILEVKVSAGSTDWSIADLLEATVDRVVDFLAAFPNSKPSQRASGSLKLLQEVGLGYLRLGQPINTLSGGESQRLKLVRHLAEFAHSEAKVAKPTLFLFDEPTTGLHFDDVRVLLQVFQRLVDAGHSVIVIEHNLDVIKCADWLIDLGPDAGDEGGRIVVCGPPETVAACKTSHTGKALKSIGL